VELDRAIRACTAALDERPWEPPSRALQDAVLAALPSASRARLTRACAQAVLPMWLDVHDDDERAIRLVEDLEPALGGDPRERALRAEVERDMRVADPALTALRAIALAHDILTGTESAERATLAELCAYAWLDARPELVPDARTSEPLARVEAFFRWWLEEVRRSA
jgi:hypothetical protein